MKIEIKSISGDVLFEFQKENNTQRDTILEAIKQKVDLNSADLRHANLRNADLSRANLSRANLSRANLSYANLSRANLSYANLGSADLRYADLSYANLTDTFISPTSKWLVTIKNDIIKIGCKEKSIEDWDKWFSGTEEFSTERGTKEFAKIQAHYESIRAYVLFMKNFIESE